MSNSELQEEEREVLLSIYEGDACFKDISPTVYQYKYGQDNDPKSFLLEIIWTDTYPTEKPKVNMDTFYNKHIISNVKEKIVNIVLTEADQYLGAAMTYSIFEFVKEKETELTEELPDSFTTNSEASTTTDHAQVVNDPDSSTKKVQKKEQLTKAQKRRQWDKVDSKGEKPRGWNWVDIVKHLSQTGSKSTPESELPGNSANS